MEKYLKGKSPGKPSTTNITKPENDDVGVATDLEPFSEFADGLGSWRIPLDKVVNSKTFQDIYTFIKGEYATKKVLFRSCRSTQRWTISSMLSV